MHDHQEHGSCHGDVTRKAVYKFKGEWLFEQDKDIVLPLSNKPVQKVVRSMSSHFIHRSLPLEVIKSARSVQELASITAGKNPNENLCSTFMVIFNVSMSTPKLLQLLSEWMKKALKDLIVEWYKTHHSLLFQGAACKNSSSTVAHRYTKKNERSKYAFPPLEILQIPRGSCNFRPISPRVKFSNRDSMYCMVVQITVQSAESSFWLELPGNWSLRRRRILADTDCTTTIRLSSSGRLRSTL